MMTKYNEVVEYHKRGMEKCEKISEEQQEILKQAHEAAEKAVVGALDEFTKGLEEKAKDWTGEDYDQFVEMAEHDNRLDGRGILTISTAYARAHEDDKERVHNSVCKKAMLEMALENVDDLLAAIGLR